MKQYTVEKKINEGLDGSSEQQRISPILVQITGGLPRLVVTPKHAACKLTSQMDTLRRHDPKCHLLNGLLYFCTCNNVSMQQRLWKVLKVNTYPRETQFM